MSAANGISIPVPARPRNDLDSAEYDPIEHLNTIFSHPSALSSATHVSTNLRSHRRELDGSIDAMVKAQTASNKQSIQQLREAQAELADLFQKIDSVRQRALETEQSITTMTADIKRLDNTKRNLTLSMTALKRLQMLTTAYEQLRSLGKTRQYRECGQLLGAVVQLMANFKSYRSIDQIAVLGRKVADVQRELLEQVCEDFDAAWQKGEVAQKRPMLNEACVVIDALGEGARSRLVMWYCNTSLREYRQIFRGNDEAGSLDNISRRYAWFSRLLKTYDLEHSQIFPPSWKMNEALASSFCENTRDDFKGILQKQARRPDGPSLDVNLLLSCLQETLDFEQGLEKRFVSDSRPSLDTISSVGDDIQTKTHTFASAISAAFEPYLSLWVEAQDRHLAAKMPVYRAAPVRNADDDFNTQQVIASSTELFQFYRLTFAQCAKLSTGARLLELSKVFAKYLDQYSQTALFSTLTERTTSTSPSATEDLVVLLNTADYCATTTTSLEEKIRARIDPDLAPRVDLQPQADALLGVASACVRALVRRIEISSLEPAWRELRATSWARVDAVGDQSSYVAPLVSSLRSAATSTFALLAKAQYARAFADALVDATTTSQLNSIAAAKPLSEAAAEQLLLDSYVIRKTLLDIPPATALSATARAAFEKRVTSTFSARADALLKTLQVRPSPPEALVQAYLLHVADRSDANFRKVLELKGLGRREQAPLVELFAAHRGAPQHAALPTNGVLLSHLNVGGAPGAAGTPQPAAPALALGSALLSAAKDVGSNVMVASAGSASRVASPPAVFPSAASSPGPGAGGVYGQGSAIPAQLVAENPGSAAAAALGEVGGNLRNLGRFFRRDLGGRFGGAAGS